MFYVCDENAWYGMPYAVGSEFMVEDVLWGVIYPIPETWMGCGRLYIIEMDGMYYLGNSEYSDQKIIIRVII